MKITTLLTVTAVVGASFALGACTTGEPNPYGNKAGDVWSGYKTATPETNAMQDDDFENPAMPVVDAALENYNADPGNGASCASCHGAPDDATGGPIGIPMIGVGAKYPVYDEQTKAPINVELRINRCRTDAQNAKEYKYESDDMQGMTALINMQSRGMPRVTTADEPEDVLNSAFQAGKEFYYERRGQLDMACKHCHEDNPANLIRAETLSQGQSNGFPTYRFKWQKMGSLHRRFRGCNKNIRAEPYAYGSIEYLNLETYLAWRGRGLPVEGPAVRK